MQEAVPSPQVSLQHYMFGQYLHKPRWSSYWQQLVAVMAMRPTSVLYIGVGDDVVPKLLEAQNVAVTRFDFDVAIGCDYVGDVAAIDEYLGENSFDVVVCCQVLEHLPYEKFLPTIKKLMTVAEKRLVLSLPYCHAPIFKANIKLPKIPEFVIDLAMPKFWKTWTFDGEHYWEIGVKGYGKKKISKAIFSVAQGKVGHAEGNKYHIFYLLDK
jgi:hypothetical protein